MAKSEVNWPSRAVPSGAWKCCYCQSIAAVRRKLAPPTLWPNCTDVDVLTQPRRYATSLHGSTPSVHAQATHPDTCPPRAVHSPPTHRLHASGRRWVPIVDCGMTALPGQGYEPYDRGLAAGVFIQDSSGQPLVGQVRDGAGGAHVPGSSG